jgi:hypothetical protein
MPRQTELADHEHVHRGPERARHLMSDWDATARKCENH